MNPSRNTTKKGKSGNPSSDTAQLFLAEVKRQAISKKGRVNYTALKRQGYSESTITKLKQIKAPAAA